MVPHAVVEKPTELDLLRAGYTDYVLNDAATTTCETKACQRLRSPV